MMKRAKPRSKADPSPALVRLETVSRYYGEGSIRVKALHQVSLTIARGEFTAVVGPSGSGKTTLLNVMGGLDQPSEGRIFLGDREVAGMSGRELSDFRRDHLGFIFQSYNLLPVLTVRENVEYVLLLQGVSASQRRERVLHILKEVGLEGKERRFPNELSGGQQQRVAVARAMVSNPDLILADEPTANLDSAHGESLLDLMRHLNEAHGKTFLFSTHDPMVMKHAKRILTFHDGKVVKDQKRAASRRAKA
jgi:putative ABC transport system ATP-binding protein